MRISVSGTRGKTTTVNLIHEALSERGLKVLSKTTGEEAILRIGREYLGIKRPRSVLEENLSIIKIPHDIAVIENQAITPYTMRVFHTMIKPRIVAITNVRLDHTEFLGETREEIARSFASSLNSCVDFLISGESRREIEEILRSGAERFSAEYIRARSYEIPGSESVGIAEEVLKVIVGEGFREEERERMLLMIERTMSVRRSGELIWYNGAKINDPESAEVVLNYLLRKYGRDFVISASFRSDRRDRTSLFAKFLRKLAAEDYVRAIFVSGHAANSVARYVGEKCTHLKENLDSVRKLVSFSLNEGVILVLLANRKTKFVDLLLNELGETSSVRN